MNRHANKIIARAAALAAIGLAVSVAGTTAEANDKRASFAKQFQSKQKIAVRNTNQFGNRKIRIKPNRGGRVVVKQPNTRPGLRKRIRPKAPRPQLPEAGKGNGGGNVVQFQIRPKAPRENAGNNNGKIVVGNRPEAPRNRQIVVEPSAKAVQPFAGKLAAARPRVKVEEETKAIEKPKAEITPKVEEKPKVELTPKVEEKAEEKAIKLTPPTIFTKKQLKIWNKMSNKDKLEALSRLIATYGYDYLYAEKKVAKKHKRKKHYNYYEQPSYSYDHGYNSYSHDSYDNGYSYGGGYGSSYGGGYYQNNSYSGSSYGGGYKNCQ